MFNIWTTQAAWVLIQLLTQVCSRHNRSGLVGAAFCLFPGTNLADPSTEGFPLFPVIIFCTGKPFPSLGLPGEVHALLSSPQGTGMSARWWKRPHTARLIYLRPAPPPKFPLLAVSATYQNTKTVPNAIKNGSLRNGGQAVSLQPASSRPQHVLGRWCSAAPRLQALKVASIFFFNLSNVAADLKRNRHLETVWLSLTVCNSFKISHFKKNYFKQRLL